MANGDRDAARREAPAESGVSCSPQLPVPLWAGAGVTGSCWPLSGMQGGAWARPHASSPCPGRSSQELGVRRGVWALLPAPPALTQRSSVLITCRAQRPAVCTTGSPGFLSPQDFFLLTFLFPSFFCPGSSLLLSSFFFPSLPPVLLFIFLFPINFTQASDAARRPSLACSTAATADLLTWKPSSPQPTSPPCQDSCSLCWTWSWSNF